MSQAKHWLYPSALGSKTEQSRSDEVYSTQWAVEVVDKRNGHLENGLCGSPEQEGGE
jgi:hypothetical protein